MYILPVKVLEKPVVCDLTTILRTSLIFLIPCTYFGNGWNITVDISTNLLTSQELHMKFEMRFGTWLKSSEWSCLESQARHFTSRGCKDQRNLPARTWIFLFNHSHTHIHFQLHRSRWKGYKEKSGISGNDPIMLINPTLRLVYVK